MQKIKGRRCRKSIHLKGGFTLVELSLSIAFIGILSITITLIISNAIMSYRRGLTLNQINTTGMDIADDIRTTIQNSPTKSIRDRCSSLYGGTASTPEDSSTEGEGSENQDDQSEEDTNYLNKCLVTDGLGFVSVRSPLGEFGKGSDTISDVPLFGALCTGAYSYIWNSGYYFSDEYDRSSQNKLSLKIGDSESINDFKLLKIRDTSRSVCIAAIGGFDGKYDLNLNYLAQNNNVIKIPKGSIVIGGDEDKQDLLASSNSGSGLALYDLTSTTPTGDDSTHSLFYSISFILGSLRGGINVNATGDFCKPPEGYNNSFDYCAINKFNFAVQATGV